MRGRNRRRRERAARLAPVTAPTPPQPQPIGESMLTELRVVVDVQHLYRPEKPLDRGAVYTLSNGTHTDEATATLIYGATIASWLKDRGATVLTNDPARGVLVGPYSRRNREAAAWQAHAYLACHLNAGGGAYGLAEYMSLTSGQPLAETIAARLTENIPGLLHSRARSLSGQDRGAVCIRDVPAVSAAVICEPFFGDNPDHQWLFAAPELARVGAVIASAVADWWVGVRAV